MAHQTHKDLRFDNRFDNRRSLVKRHGGVILDTVVVDGDGVPLRRVSNNKMRTIAIA